MLTRRLLLLRMILLAVFLAFAGKLAYLQLWQGHALREVSQHNRLRLLRVPPKRGLIIDRTGAVLATNVPAPVLWLVSGEVPRQGWNDLLHRLVAIGIYPDLDTATTRLAAARRYPSARPLCLQSHLTVAQISRVEEALPFLPGVYINADQVRSYPRGELASHVLGYLREVDADELTAHAGEGYLEGDSIGKSGLEKRYEADLRGVEGIQEVEVDARGNRLRTVSTTPPVDGSTLTLTLNAVLQEAAETALRGKRGAVVALDPATGDVLALASAPTYDPNKMSTHLSPASWAWLMQSHALVNRGTERYPPGSVFKIVTAAAALEAGAAGDGTYFNCPGVYKGIHCWHRAGHKVIGLTEAIAQSCNVAFMRMAENTGIRRLDAMGTRFGLGMRTGLELPEKRGLVPGPDWAKTTDRTWQLGDTLQVGIGQSFCTITPLQGARIAAAIANGGKLVHPRLVQRVGDTEFPYQAPTPIGLNASTLRAITRGLRAVTGEGTARGLDPTLRIAGKTGTAQNPGDDHAWFVGYAPAERPTIAVAVIIEHGGHGGSVAAPVAQAVIRALLQPEVATAIPPSPER